MSLHVCYVFTPWLINLSSWNFAYGNFGIRYPEYGKGHRLLFIIITLFNHRIDETAKHSHLKLFLKKPISYLATNLHLLRCSRVELNYFTLTFNILNQSLIFLIKNCSRQNQFSRRHCSRHAPAQKPASHTSACLIGWRMLVLAHWSLGGA